MQDTQRPRTISRRETIRLLPLGAGLVTAAVGTSSIAGSALAAVAAAPAPATGGGAASGMTQDTSALAADHFAGLVGETFTVGAAAAVLKEIRRGPKSAGFREQFAVVFDAPQAGSVPLVPLPVSHPAIGRHDLLVTPIGGGAALEICFA